MLIFSQTRLKRFESKIAHKHSSNFKFYWCSYNAPKTSKCTNAPKSVNYGNAPKFFEMTFNTMYDAIWYNSVKMSRLVLRWYDLIQFCKSLYLSKNDEIWCNSANMSIIVLNWYKMIQLDCMMKYSKNWANQRTFWQTTKLFLGSRAKRSSRSKRVIVTRL